MPEEEPRGETTRRKLSLATIMLRITRIVFSMLLLKFFFPWLNLPQQIIGPVMRFQQGSASLLDCCLICFTGYAFIGQFSVFYVVFYGSCRLIGDLQQFALSPLFDPTEKQMIKKPTNRQTIQIWRDASLWDRIRKTELYINGYMPEGPACLLGSLSSAGVWR